MVDAELTIERVGHTSLANGGHVDAINWEKSLIHVLEKVVGDSRQITAAVLFGDIHTSSVFDIPYVSACGVLNVSARFFTLPV